MAIVSWTLWVVLLFTVLHCIQRWFSETRELVAPVPICLATIGFYVLSRAAYLMWYGEAPLTSAGLLQAEQLETIAMALAMALVGVLAFTLGSGRRSADRAAARIRFALPDPDPSRAVWIAGGAALLGVAALAHLITSLGSIEYALRHQYELSILLQDKQPVFQLTRLLIVPSALLLVDPARRRSRPLVWTFAVAVAVALFLLGRRGFVVMALGFPLALHHLTVRRIPTPWFLAFALPGMIGLFALGYLRLLGGDRLGQTARIFTKDPATAIHVAFNATGELKIFDALTIVVRDIPSEVDFSYGTSFARVPWMIIPRQLWHEKPVTLGETIVRRYVPGLRTGYPPTAIGEFYAAAGPLGVVLGFFAFGWIARLGWAWYQRRPGVGNATAYLTLCFFAFDFTRVGDPSRTGWFFLLGILFFSFAFSVASRPRKTRLQHP